MAMAPRPERRFLGDAGSLKSFRGNGSSSNPPSFKTSSLKAKKPLVPTMPSLLSRTRRWAQSGDSSDFDVKHRRGIKDKDFNAPAPKPFSSLKPEEMPSTSQARGSPAGAENSNASGQNKPEIAQRPTTRSKTIFRLFSAKFRSRSPLPGQPPSPPILSHLPTQGASAFASKENREAALRERGLLPPLRPNADLSQAERERDRHLPVLPPPSNDEILAVTGEARKVSAASVVKQEWEAKNKSPMNTQSQQERMNSFKFGGLAPSPVPMEDTPAILSTPLIPVEEVDTPLPSPVAASRSADESSETSPRPSSARSKRSLLAHSVEGDSPNLSIAVQQSSAPYEPHLVPLPPSPLPSQGFAPTTSHQSHDGRYTLAASIPLPPSPDPSLKPNTLSPCQNPPTISLSPPAIFTEKTEEDVSIPSDTLLPPFAPRTADSEAGSSHLTPSFETASQTTTTPTLSTTQSASSIGLRSRPMGLTVNIHELKVPIFLENPVEEPILEGSISPGLAGDLATIKVAIADDTANTSAAPNAERHPVPRPRGRNFTEPPSLGLKAPDAERRKSFNPFKRSQTLSPRLTSDPPPSAQRRLSVSASISNMRRSFIGTVSRPKPEKGPGPDAPHPPPSPTIPAASADRLSKNLMNPASPNWALFLPGAVVNERPSPPELKPRQAVSPTLYSRGSILLEASHIEDEEMRRMTELAFLG